MAMSSDPNMNPNMAMPFVLQTMLPAGFKGLAVAGVIAVVMSSADSYLNASAIAVVHDIIQPLKKVELAPRTELRLAQISTLVIGLLAIVFAIAIESALDILLYSYNFWSPIILVPLVGGILGAKVTSRGFLLCAMFGVSGVVAWNSFGKDLTGIDGLVIGVAMNALCYIVLACKPKTAVQDKLFEVSS